MTYGQRGSAVGAQANGTVHHRRSVSRPGLHRLGASRRPCGASVAP
jgi:hypothetical protein